MKWLLWRKFFLLIIAFPCLSQADEAPSSTEDNPVCAEPFRNSMGNTTKNLEPYLDQLNLHLADAVQFLIVGPLTLAFCLILIVVFFRYPKSRQKPGDMMLAMTLTEIVLAVLFILVGARYFLQGHAAQESRSNLCKGTAVLNLFFSLSHYLYNYSFCLFLFSMVRNLLKKKEASTLSFHLVCFLGPAFFLILIAIFENFGKNIYGTCSINAVSIMFFWRPLIICIYMLLALLTVVYFKYNVHKKQGTHSFKKKYLNYYYSYVKITILVWGIQGLCDIIVLSACTAMHYNLVRSFLILGNFSDSASPLLLSFFRLYDPFINKRFHRIKKALAKRFCACCIGETKVKVNKKGLKYVLSKNGDLQGTAKQDGMEVEMRKTQEMPPELKPSKGGDEDAQAKEQANVSELHSQSSIESHMHWIQNIRGQMKINLISSIIAGVIIDHLATKAQVSEGPQEEGASLLSEEAFKREKVYDIEDSDVIKLIGQEGAPKERNEKGIYKNRLFSTAYKGYALLRNQRSKFVNYEDSLDIGKNEKQILKAGGADGGRGGQFFLFTHDCRLIIKTLTREEYLEMVRMSEEFFTYLQQNRSSLIAPVLGVYKIKRRNFAEKQKYYFVLMRNLAMFNRDSIERVYDMKGSSDDRKVLKKQGHQDPQKLTLKDTDFKNLEQKVHIDQQKAKLVVSALAQDSLFFASKGFMDYSLLVIKINKDKLSPEEAAFSLALQKEESFAFASARDSSIVYHIGLIDYLQKWNMKKIAEKYTKQYLLHKKDPSAQDPRIYMERFIKFVEEIF